jgi:hypothetical protein
MAIFEMKSTYPKLIEILLFISLMQEVFFIKKIDKNNIFVEYSSSNSLENA